MNDDQIVENIIDFIEKKERDVQASKFISANQAKIDIVQAVLKELDSELEEVADEN